MAGDYLFEHPWGLASQEVYAIIGNPDDASQVRDVVANEWDNLSVDSLDRWVVAMTPHAQNARLHVLTLPVDLETTRSYPVRIKHRLESGINSEADPLLGVGFVRAEKNIDAILDDTGAAGVVVNTFTTAGKAELQQEATDALNAYDPPTRAEATSDANSILAYVDLIDDGTSGLAKIATDVAAILVDTGTTLDAFIQAVKAKTDNLPSDPADASVIASATSAIEAKIDIVDTVVDAVKVKTDQLNFTGTDVKATLDGEAVAVGTNNDKTGYELTTAYDVYHADIKLNIDDANSQDEYTITWFKNGVRITSGITSPTLQVVKRADGTDLIASTTPTQIASTGSYKYDATGSSRMTAGQDALAIVSATIDGGSRTFPTLVGRDSSA